jgi:hypothetical protein
VSDPKRTAPKGAWAPGAGGASVLAVGALVFLLIVWPFRAPDLPGVSSAEGYINIIDKMFVANRWLEATPPAELQDANDVVAERQGLVQLSQEAKQIPSVQAFLRNSYLSRDLLRVEPVIWSIQNGLVTGIDEGAHAVPLPSQRPEIWTGDLNYRETQPAEIQMQLTQTDGAGPNLLFVQPSLTQKAGFQSKEESEDVLVTQGANGQYTSVRFLLTDGPAGKGSVVAQFYQVGNVLIVVPEQSAYQVLVNGEAVTMRARAIRPGNRVEVVSRRRGADREVYQSWRAEEVVIAPPALSTYRPWSLRQRSNEAPDLTQAIELSLSRYINNEDKPGTFSNDADVFLTLDGQMQAQLNALLRRYVRDPDVAVALKLRGVDDYQIAVTVMDALTGEILALGQSIKQPPSIDDQDITPEDRTPPLNLNFRRLQIGSAAKPLIAAAILESNPSLSTFALVGKSEVEEDSKGRPIRLKQILGRAFEPGDNTLGGENGEGCDFNCFMRQSSNRYAAALMLMAASPPQRDFLVATNGAYSLNGQPQAFRDASRFEGEGPIKDGPTVPRPASGPTVSLDWYSRVQALYRVPYRAPNNDSRLAMGDPPYLGDDNFNMGVWTGFPGLVATAGGGSQTSGDQPDLWRSFYGATPERENFRLDRASKFRESYLPVMLGGGEGSWTTVTMAEAYSRLVTRRAVEARLFRRLMQENSDELSLEPTSSSAQFAVLPLKETVHQIVTDAMALVTGVGGTAYNGFEKGSEGAFGALQSQLPAAWVLRIFSKTGTPELQILRFGPVERAVNDLIRIGRVQLNEQRVLVLQTNTNIAFTSANRVRLRAALRADGDALRVVNRAGVGADAVVERLISDAANVGDRTTSPFEEVSNANILIRYKLNPERSRNTDNEAFGKVFTFVVGAFPADKLGARGLPRQAFTVAINIQSPVSADDNAPGDGKIVHTRLGGEIFRKILAPRLATGPERRP